MRIARSLLISRREFGENKPTMVQAGVYSSVMHYLKAVEQVGSAEDGAAVVAAMKEIPTEDKLFGEGHGPRRRAQDPRHVSL